MKIQVYCNVGLKDVRNLSEEEFSKFIRAQQQILFIHQAEELFELLKHNFSDFWSYLFEVAENYRFKNLNYVNAEATPVLFINQKLANYLSSYKTYEDHLRHKMSRIYGTKSEKIAEYNKLLNEEYDKYFEYRFFVKLRNFIQHFGLPIKSIYYAQQVTNKETMEIANTVYPRLERDFLLGYDGWGKVKEEIKKMDENINIKPFVSIFFNRVYNIHKHVRKIIYENFNDYKLLIEQYYNECIETKKKYVVEYLNPWMTPYVSMNDELLIIPHKQVKFISELIKNNDLHDSVGTFYTTMSNDV
ncbi:MAG: hypothetical protein M1495_11095 [Bacteroidetes bacterium]|nr:hypothetical protein [Bacteroidota bacterium]